MSSFEESEFEELIGDQIVTVRRSHEELLAQGEIELAIDGHKVRISRITKGYDPVGKKATSRLTTIYDAANQLYVKELQQKNPDSDSLPSRAHDAGGRMPGVRRRCQRRAAPGPVLPEADRARHGSIDDPHQSACALFRHHARGIAFERLPSAPRPELRVWRNGRERVGGHRPHPGDHEQPLSARRGRAAS